MEFQNPDELIKYADERIYRAKRAGKAQILYAAKRAPNDQGRSKSEKQTAG